MSEGSETGATGTAKRQHDATGPPAKRRQTDRVTLDVGGTIFHTTENTLTSSSSYFSRLFSGPWQDAAGDEPRFLDRDADAFRVLLSCLRNRTVVLPEADPALCTRVLLEAEFFGVEWLLQQVKERVSDNTGADFDRRFPGGITEAVTEGDLPARYFGPEPTEPPVLPQLMALPQGSVIAVTGHDTDERETAYSVPFALVTPSEDGASLPTVTFVDTSEDGELVKYSDYPDFRRFTTSTHIGMKQRQKAWAHAKQFQIQATIASTMFPEALKAGARAGTDTSATQDALSKLVDGSRVSLLACEHRPAGPA